MNFLEQYSAATRVLVLSIIATIRCALRSGKDLVVSVVKEGLDLDNPEVFNTVFNQWFEIFISNAMHIPMVRQYIGRHMIQRVAMQQFMLGADYAEAMTEARNRFNLLNPQRIGEHLVDMQDKYQAIVAPVYEKLANIIEIEEPAEAMDAALDALSDAFEVVNSIDDPTEAQQAVDELLAEANKKG